jgi:hypothetical protein
MGVMNNTDLQAILDKIARWAALSVGDAAFSGSFNAGMEAANAAVISGTNSIAKYILDSNDLDFTADVLPAARNLDEANPTPPTRFLFGIAGIAALVTALNSHFTRYTAFTTLDAYLTNLNASTPTLRVHQAFHDHIKSMSRKNVFIAADTVLATFAATGASTGVFTSLATIPTAYAGAKLVIKNQGAVTTGATLSVTGKKLDGTTQVITATIATGTDNTETNLSSLLRLFSEVTAVSIASGTNANIYEIVAKTDRDISAA